MIKSIYQLRHSLSLIVRIILSLLLLGFNACSSRNAEDNPSTEPNMAYYKLAQEALSAWDIGLNINHSKKKRNAIKNWITVAADDCVAEGISNCGGFSGSVVGMCLIKFHPTTGEIVETTSVIQKSYLEGIASEEQKRSVFIHEIGHCLGLRHTTEILPPASAPCSGSAFCVMHPTVGTDNLTPHADELSAVKAAYNPIRNPTDDAHKKHYKTITGGTEIRRQHQNPEFYISGSIGNAARFEDESITNDEGERSTLRYTTKINEDNGFTCSSELVAE